jgi:membrane fusion protein, multidrug efflux system
MVNNSSGRTSRIWLLFLLLLSSGAYMVWQRTSGAEPGDPPPKSPAKQSKGAASATPVVAVRALRGDIGVYYAGLGAVTPIHTVTVRSRVDGQLMRVHYTEGDMVKENDLLAEIDPRPFQVQLEQAQGQLAKDQAMLANARVDMERYAKLLKQNAVQEQLYATQQAAVRQDEGIVKADQGAVDSAQLNLVYSKITAPISGRVGLRLVDPGNIVHASDANGLLVITEIQPISVLFTLAEDQLQVVLRKLAAHQRLRAETYDRENQNLIAAGTLTTVDNQIDPSTGTLRLRAVFDNRNSELFPNQFVNVRLLVEKIRGATLIPTAAIQRTPTSKFVYLVKPDSTVTVRPITDGVTQGEESQITSGLNPGEVVVLTGVDRLQEGSPVRAEMNQQQPSGENAPAGFPRQPAARGGGKTQ